MSDLTNIDNPLNHRHDEETRNQPHVTPVPAEAQADDLFDDAVEDKGRADARGDCPVRHNPVEER